MQCNCVYCPYLISQAYKHLLGKYVPIRNTYSNICDWEYIVLRIPRSPSGCGVLRYHNIGFFGVYVSCYFFYYLPERLRLWICHTVPHCEFWWHQVSNLKNFRLYMECLHNVTYCSSFCFEYFLIWCTLYRKKKWFFNFCYFLAFNCCYKTLIITIFKSSCQR